MNWIKASIDLDDDQAKAETKSTDLNRFTVRRGKSSYKSIKQATNVTLMATVFSLYFSDLLLIKGLLHYIASFGPS